jgi:hypothetical protein
VLSDIDYFLLKKINIFCILKLMLRYVALVVLELPILFQIAFYILLLCLTYCFAGQIKNHHQVALKVRGLR